MLTGILKQINWVDIFVVILFIRACYISSRQGLPVEFFKLLGTIAAIYLSLHYYTIFADFIRVRVKLPDIPLQFLDFVCFVLCAVLGFIFFTVLQKLFCRYLSIDSLPDLNKWGGLILGVIRGFLFISLVMFMLNISTISYLKKSVNESYSKKYLFQPAPATYSFLWNSFFSRYMTQEKFNKTILEVQLPES